MKVCKILGTSRVTSGSRSSRSMKSGKKGISPISLCVPSSSPSGTMEQQESGLSAHGARQSGPVVVCVQLTSTSGLQTWRASQLMLDGSACVDFLSITDNPKDHPE